MRNIAIEFSYDGTGYYGVQYQREVPTVQGVMEEALARITKERVRLKISGRTDTGVHAVGQVGSFITRSKMSPWEFKIALNSELPQDIRVNLASEMPMDFHPRYSAIKRWYRYIIYNSRTQSPFIRNHAVWIPFELDLGLLNSYAREIIGTHDFSAFATVERGDLPLRTVYEARFIRKGDFVIFDIIGRSFLRKMVRTLVGTFLYLEKHKVSPVRVREILLSRDRKQAGDSAKPYGLYLYKIFYPEKYQRRLAESTKIEEKGYWSR